MGWIKSKKVYAILMNSEEGKDIVEQASDLSQEELDNKISDFFENGNPNFEFGSNDNNVDSQSQAYQQDVKFNARMQHRIDKFYGVSLDKNDYIEDFKKSIDDFKDFASKYMSKYEVSNFSFQRVLNNMRVLYSNFDVDEWRYILNNNYNDFVDMVHSINEVIFKNEIEEGKKVLNNFPDLQKEETIEECLKAINPDFNTFNGTNDAYKSRQNCQRCVVAYLIRRLYKKDVSATFRTNKDADYDILSKTNFLGQSFSDWSFKGFIGAYSIRNNMYDFTKFIGKNDDRAKRWDDMSSVKKGLDEEIKKAGNGAIFGIYCSNQTNNSAHIFIGENVNGEVRYIDPQSNKADVSYRFDPKNPYKLSVSRISFTRMDNLPVSKFIDLYIK